MAVSPSTMFPTSRGRDCCRTSTGRHHFRPAHWEGNPAWFFRGGGTFFPHLQCGGRRGVPPQVSFCPEGVWVLAAADAAKIDAPEAQCRARGQDRRYLCHARWTDLCER